MKTLPGFPLSSARLMLIFNHFVMPIIVKS